MARSGVLGVVSEQNPNIGGYYAEQVGKHVESFVGSWGVLVGALGPYAEHLPPPGHALSDRERQDVKARFTCFNKELEAVHASADAMSVPDAALAASIRKAIKEAVLPPYSLFYNTSRSQLPPSHAS